MIWWPETIYNTFRTIIDVKCIHRIWTQRWCNKVTTFCRLSNVIKHKGITSSFLDLFRLHLVYFLKKCGTRKITLLMTLILTHREDIAATRGLVRVSRLQNYQRLSDSYGHDDGDLCPCHAPFSYLSQCCPLAALVWPRFGHALVVNASSHDRPLAATRRSLLWIDYITPGKIIFETSAPDALDGLTSFRR